MRDNNREVRIRSIVEPFNEVAKKDAVATLRTVLLFSASKRALSFMEITLEPLQIARTGTQSNNPHHNLLFEGSPPMISPFHRGPHQAKRYPS